MNRVTVLILSIMFFSTPLYAENFSWYEYKKTKLEAKEGFFKNNNKSNASDDEKTKKYIKERYNLYTSKKSIKDIMESKSKNSLYAGLEYSFNPEYETRKIVNLVNSDGSVTQTQIIEKKSLGGVALRLEGDLDLSPVGLNADSLIAKVALSSNYIDMDMNYRIVGESDSAIMVSAGAGVRAAMQESDVFTKGFYGYGTGEASIGLDGYKVSGGVRYLFTKPEIYKSGADKMSPYISGSMSF